MTDAICAMGGGGREAKEKESWGRRSSDFCN